jgi:hypothetical protein
VTPLAQYLAKQLVARPKDRKHSWSDPRCIDDLREWLSDIHCFEVLEVNSLIGELITAMHTQEKADEIIAERRFLPAPKTWIEYRYRGRRIAILLQEIPQEKLRPVDGIRIEKPAIAMFFCEEMAMNLGVIPMAGSGRAVATKNQIQNEKILRNFGLPPMEAQAVYAQLALILINSPRIIGRRQHMPHTGLERQLTRSLAGGKFPLHAWTEIKLQVAKPVEIDDGEPHEAHLTGRRALHFVRKHIRIRLGQLEYVSAHWRGDPSIGIKRSRYTVRP